MITNNPIKKTTQRRYDERIAIILIFSIWLLLSGTLIATGSGPLAQTGVAILPLTRAGTDPSNPTNDAVVSIQTVGGGPGCTGTLVSPTLVITAGHCLLGAIIDGGSGQWNSQSPIWRSYNLPEPSANAGWTSRIRGARSRIYFDSIIAPFNYRQEAVANVFACHALCESEGRCQGWTYQNSTNQCFLKDTPRFQVNFGNTHGGASLTVTSSTYSVPGFADIAMMRLDTPVPVSTAIPALVISHLPDATTGIANFLRGETYQAVGFSPVQPTRQTVAMSFTAYPYADGFDAGGDLAMVEVAGAGGAVTEGGDSGSPLFALRRVGSRQQRFVVGILQGYWGLRNRYTLTGVNLRQRGQLLTMPYDRDTLDLRRSAPIGEWLNNVMYADFAASSGRRPLYNWYGERGADNFLTSDPRWASDPRGAATDASGEYLWPRRMQNGYGMYRLEGYVFNPHAPQPAGTIALWSWFSPARTDNFATTDPRWASDPASISWAGEHLSRQRSQDDYTQYRLEGYIYDPRRPQPPNTRPLFSWFHPGRGDNFHTTDPRWSIPASSIRWTGENLATSEVRDGYSLYRLEGYVAINPN